MSDESVRVAVRVRPFNDREKARKAVNIIQMPDDKRTGILDPANLKGDAKFFSFDYSYWSHDGFREDENGCLQSTDSKYADQRRVFDDLGRGVLDNAWKGYNCSLFAYGQTGSGKSYSMVGYGVNKGIVPIACEELFNQIKNKQGDNIEYQVSVYMMEIYMEKVRDLLDPNPPPKGGLKVREHPKKGFYVENLKAIPVNNYKSIEAKIEEGTRNRTVAATNMNATSSRAHTIVQLNFVQKGKNDSGVNTTKTSIINLVDLAGSERHNDAGTEGDRLKEGIVINQSLSTLGRCIKALHDNQLSKGKKVSVPYRDSVLTSLLKNALGGNSKTVMMAALSPADISYEETLSTLRFADRAKSIKTKAFINESATDRMIRELREENKRLMTMVGGGGGGGGGGGANSEELEALRQQLEQNKMEMAQTEQTWQSRLAQEAVHTKSQTEQQARVDAERKTTPHFWNLNEDPALTDMIVHLVKPGDNRVGNNKAQPPPNIQLNGLSIQKDHAKVRNDGNKRVFINPLPGAKLLINGKEISKEQELFHNDRILFGGNHLYVFGHPTDMEKKRKSGQTLETITFAMAQQEIGETSGLFAGSNAAGKSKEDMILEEELIHLLPQVYQANAMSDELKKNVKFEIVLVAPQARGLKTGHTEIFVKVVNKSTDHEFMWEKNKFANRYYGMQELYQNFVEGYSDWDVPKERDPFYEPSESEVHIGSVHVYLQSLAYMVELDEQLPISDFKGNERGQLSVALFPCTPQGKEITGEFVDSPNELIGKNLCFKVKILNAIGLPRKFSSSRCKYKFYLEDKEAVTPLISGSNPSYGFEKKFTFKPVTKQLVDYLKDQALYIEVTGVQGGASGPRTIPEYNTSGSDYKNKADRLEAKLNKIQNMLDDALSSDTKSVSVRAVQKVLRDDDDGLMVNGTASEGKPKKSKKKGSAESKKSSSTSKSSAEKKRTRSKPR